MREGLRNSKDEVTAALKEEKKKETSGAFLSGCRWTLRSKGETEELFVLHYKICRL